MCITLALCSVGFYCFFIRTFISKLLNFFKDSYVNFKFIRKEDKERSLVYKLFIIE